jgi:hypothetical protein
VGESAGSLLNSFSAWFPGKDGTMLADIFEWANDMIGNWYIMGGLILVLVVLIVVFFVLRNKRTED